jgi:diguanylate cyclase (GGDEF)-like protein
VKRGLSSFDRLLAHRVGGPSSAFAVALAGYIGLAWCGDQLVSASSGLATFWPANGLLIALVLLLAPRLRPWVVAAALPGELIIDAIQGSPLGVALGWGTVNVLEVSLAAWIILRLIGRDRPLADTARDYAAVGIASAAAPLVCGFGGAAVSVASFGGSYGSAWLDWWVGDVTGIALLVALVVSLVLPGEPRTARQRFAAYGAIGLVVAAGAAVFTLTRQPLTVVTVPPLVLVAVRFGLRPTAIASVALAIVATIFTGHGLGPFSRVPAGEGRVLVVQAYVATTAFVAFVVSATMSARRRTEAALEHLATHDLLTGLPNRRYLMERLDQTAGRRDRSVQGAAIAYFDLDGLKEINDTFGHATGDAVLIEVGRRLRDAARSSDLVARIGGDEFAELLEPVDDLDGAETAVRRTVNLVEQPFTLGEITLRIGISAGTALIGNSGELALTHADIQLYEDKAHGHPARVGAVQG